MMELNKYDLVEWVAEILIVHDHTICRHCMFKDDLNHCHPKNWRKIKYFNMPICHYDKETLIKEIIKKYNL